MEIVQLSALTEHWLPSHCLTLPTLQLHFSCILFLFNIQICYMLKYFFLKHHIILTSHFNLPHVVWLKFTDEGLILETRVWGMLYNLIFNLCIHLSRSQYLYSKSGAVYASHGPKRAKCFATMLYFPSSGFVTLSLEFGDRHCF